MPTAPRNRRTPAFVDQAAGWLLVVVGILWVVLSGGCTLIFAVPQWREPTSFPGVWILLCIGGLFVAPGVFLLWLGLIFLGFTRRQTDERTDDP